VANRLLLTGHSHQAWPDAGFEGQQRAWLDAARYTDDKWERAFAMADRVRAGYAALLDDAGADIALASNTHELVVRFLSALPLARRPRLVTTDGEFHSIRRQLDRLAEAGLQVVKVAARPVDGLADRLAAAVAAAPDRTAAVLVSSVLFLDARIVPGLGRVAEACAVAGAELLVDVYHHLCAVPCSLRAEGLDGAFVTGGGYKYCQLGEGNAFLRSPPGCRLRPVVTGWFSEFSALSEGDDGSAPRVAYGQRGDRFAGATYDPTSHYRAAAVLDFFRDRGLAPALLRQASQHQLGVLAAAFDALDADPAVIDRDRATPLDRFGGFLALRAPAAGALQARLRERGVQTDHRGDILRLGPAPYLSDRQLRDAVGVLGEAVREVVREVVREGLR
jgi:kynureninase